MIDSNIIEKLKAGCDDVQPGDPAAVPFLDGLDAFLLRWYGVGLDTAHSFRNVTFRLSDADSNRRGYVEVTIVTPFDSLSGWWWEGVIQGFGVDGLIEVNLQDMPMETFEASACKRRWLEAREEIGGDDADVHFWIERHEDGSVTDRFRNTRDRG